MQITTETSLGTARSERDIMNLWCKYSNKKYQFNQIKKFTEVTYKIKETYSCFTWSYSAWNYILLT